MWLPYSLGTYDPLGTNSQSPRSSRVVVPKAVKVLLRLTPIVKLPSLPAPSHGWLRVWKHKHSVAFIVFHSPLGMGQVRSDSQKTIKDTDDSFSSSQFFPDNPTTLLPFYYFSMLEKYLQIQFSQVPHSMLGAVTIGALPDFSSFPILYQCEKSDIFF